MTGGFSFGPSEAAGALAPDSPARIADAFLDSYVSWREASEAVRAAYEHWRAGQRRDRGPAFDAYRAALDREEHAALTFRERAKRMCHPLT